MVNLSIVLERPKSAEHGDFATNLALVLAKPLKQNPRVIAAQIIDAMPASEYIAKTEIAGAGFINFFLNPQSKQVVIKEAATTVKQVPGGLSFSCFHSTLEKTNCQEAIIFADYSHTGQIRRISRDNLSSHPQVNCRNHIHATILH